MDGRQSGMEMMKFAVLGNPISHSKSPVIHQAAYAYLGLDWTYESSQIDAADLESFLDGQQQNFDGFSLTMPLKEQLVALAVKKGWGLDSYSALLNSANTLYKRSTGDWEVANTDVHGAGLALEAITGGVDSVALLGSGATARSIALAISLKMPDLKELIVFSRRPEPAEQIFALVSVELPNLKASWLPIEAAADFGGADLTVNTVPGDVAGEHEIDRSFGESWVFDVAYQPWPTRLAQAWPESNRISGLDMLVWQAIEQLRLFGAIPREFEIGKVAELAERMRAAAL